MPQKQFLQIWSKIQPTPSQNIDQTLPRLCHQEQKKKKRSCKSSYEFNVTKTYRSISNNFVSYPPANPISYLHKNCLRANQILNGCQIWSTAVYNSLMVRTYIFETRIPISPWRRSLSLSLSLSSRIYSPTPRLIALWDMYDLSPRSARRIFTSMGR